MVRGKNPDGTPKRYPTDERRKAANRKRPRPYVEAIVIGGAPRPPDTPSNEWSRDPFILRRVEQIERLRLAGLSMLETSKQLGLPIQTVVDDWQRLNELWLARVSGTQDALRSEAVRRLDTVIRNGFEVLRMDEAYTQAVLFNMPVLVTCPGRQEHATRDMLLSDPLSQPIGTSYGEAFSCTESHGMYKRVYHDEKGSAQYRRVAGQVLQAINTAIMNQARIQGLVVEKKSLTDAEGKDLPAALRAILLGEEMPEMAALPGAELP